MNRCKPSSIVKPVAAALLLLAAAAVFSISPPAVAQVSDARPTARQFPPAAMRGEMLVKNHPLVAINGKSEQLSPGARIFDQNNMLVLSGQLAGRDEVLVNYLRDGGGQIHQVWILNSEEAKEKRAGSNRTVFNFITDLFSSSPPASPAP